MPTTPRGLPYPSPTGVAPDVPYYMQQLAEEVESKFLEHTHGSARRMHLALNVTASGGGITTDSSGYITVVHGAGFTPRAVFALPMAGGVTLGHVIAADGFTSTTVRLRFANYTTNTILDTATIGGNICLLCFQ